MKTITINSIRPALILFFCFLAQAMYSQQCVYNGKSYSKGSIICISGYEYRCDDGEWEYLGTSCGNSITKSEFTTNDKSKNSTIKSLQFQNFNLSPCALLYSVGSVKKVGIRNNCAECKRVVISWGSDGIKKYDVKGYGNLEIDVESMSGQIIGEEPCK